MVLRISKTRLQLFVRCPYLYYRVYEKGDLHYDNLAMAYGSAFHALAAEFGRRAVPRETYNETVQAFVKLAKQLSQPYPSTLQKWMHRFARFEALRWAHEPNYFRPVAIELPVKFQDSQFFYDVVIDRITRYEHGLVIWEFKTSSYDDMTSLRRELAFYAHIVNSAHVFSRPVGMVAFFNPNTCKWARFSIHHKTAYALARWMTRFREAHETGEFPRRLGHWCPHCPLFRECIGSISLSEVVEQMMSPERCRGDAAPLPGATKS